MEEKTKKETIGETVIEQDIEKEDFLNVPSSRARVKEKSYKFSLGAGEDSEVVHTTEKITGELQAIIVDAERPVSIMIRLSDYPGITVYENTGVVGQKYCSLQVQPIAEDGQRFKISTAKWILNDKLDIIVKDNVNTNVSIKLRYI